MNANKNVKSSSSIEQQLSPVIVSPDLRRQVIHDVQFAESIIDAVEWVWGKFKRPNANAFVKPSPKYQE